MPAIERDVNLMYRGGSSCNSSKIDSEGSSGFRSDLIPEMLNLIYCSSGFLQSTDLSTFWHENQTLAFSHEKFIHVAICHKDLDFFFNCKKSFLIEYLN